MTSDPFPPVVTVISPQPESEVTGPIEIVASITDPTIVGEPEIRKMD